MRVIVDTSVWSAALRKPLRPEREPQAAAHRLRHMIEDGDQILLLGVILQEILQGIREPRAFEKIHRYLEAFPILPLSEAESREARTSMFSLGKVSFNSF